MKGKKIDIKDIIENIKKYFKKYFSTNILFTTYVLTSILIGILVRAFTVANITEFKPILLDLVVVLIIGAFGYFIKPRNQFKYFFTCSILFTFLGIGNVIYYEFFKSFLSLNLLSTASMMGGVTDSIFVKLRIHQFIFIIAPLTLLFVHRKLNKRKYYFEVEKIEKGKQMFIKTLSAGAGLLILIVATLSAMDVSRFVKQWNREYIVQRFGLYTYTLNDAFQSIQPKINALFGYEDAALQFNEFYTEKRSETVDKNKYTGIYKDKNVVFIHAESIQSFLIDLKINGVEVTPNLNKLSKEGLYFSKFYPQISVGTSSDTEFTLSTGLMPSSSGTVFVSYFDRTYESIQKKFTDLGYYVFSMHANNGDYWNRNQMHASLGYKKYYSKNSFEIPTSEEDPNWIVLGLSDKSFFKQLTPKLKEIKENNSKYFGTVITLTNHSPFKDDVGGIDKYGEFKLTQSYKTTDENGNSVTMEAPYLENTDMGNYIKSVHYADAALGELFDNLKAEGILENTVFVIYGDHEAKLGRRAFDLLYNYDPYTNDIKPEDDPTYYVLDDYNYDLLKNTPLIMWTSDKKEKKEITDVMGMYDVAPTIGNMFGFEMEYSLGNDIFSKKEKIVIFPNGNFLTNLVYFNNLKDAYLPLTNSPIDADYIKRLKEYTEKRLDISNLIIIHDLILNEGNKLEVQE